MNKLKILNIVLVVVTVCLIILVGSIVYFKPCKSVVNPPVALQRPNQWNLFVERTNNFSIEYPNTITYVTEAASGTNVGFGDKDSQMWEYGVTIEKTNTTSTEDWLASERSKKASNQVQLIKWLQTKGTKMAVVSQNVSDDTGAPPTSKRLLGAVVRNGKLYSVIINQSFDLNSEINPPEEFQKMLESFSIETW